MIKLQLTYINRMETRAYVVDVNLEHLLSDDVERFTAVDSADGVRACRLCCCAIVLDINVLALPVEAHLVTDKPNQRESPLLLSISENTLCTSSHANSLNDLFKSTRKIRLATRLSHAPIHGLVRDASIPNSWRGVS